MGTGNMPIYVDEVLAALPTSGGPSTKPQFNLTSDNHIELLNAILQEGTRMVAGQMNNHIDPTITAPWGTTDTIISRVGRFHIYQTTIQRHTPSPPVATLAPPFDPNIEAQRMGRRILYEAETWLDETTPASIGINLVFRDRLFTRDGVDYSILQERNGQAFRQVFDNPRGDWRISFF